MKGDWRLSDIIPDRVAAAVIDPTIFGAMVQKLADQHGDNLGAADPYIAAFHAFVESKDIRPGEGEDQPDLNFEDFLELQGMTARLFAMIELEKAGHLNNWVREKDDHVMLNGSLISAACDCQLLPKGKGFYFQPLEFLNHALATAMPNQPIL